MHTPLGAFREHTVGIEKISGIFTWLAGGHDVV
jgi:hypothetical protein